MLKRLLLTLGLLLAVPVDAQNCSPCAVNAVARFDLYVSNVDYGGIPVGNDTTGNGSPASPYLTVDRALQQRLTGTALHLNGNPASPAVYTTSAGLPVGTYSILAVNDYGAIIAGTGTTQALTLPLDAHVTLGKVICDPSQNSGGAAPVCLTIPSNATTASRMEITLVGTKVQGWTTQAINANGTTRANITSSGAIFSAAGSVQGAYFINAFAAGAFSSTGDTCTLGAQNLASLGGCAMIIGAAGGTETVSISNMTASCTLDAALVGAGLHYCVRIHEVPAATVSGGSYSILGAPGSRQGAAVYLSNTSVDISGGSISNVTVVNTTNGGYGCGIGNEAAGPPVPSNMLVDGCHVTGNSVSGLGGMHGVFMGLVQNSIARNSSCTTCGLSYVNKLTTNVTFTGNTASGFYSSGLLVKGAVGAAMTNNAITESVAAAAAIGWHIEDDPTAPTHSTDAVLTGNTITNAAGTAFVFGTLDTSNTFAVGSPANDNYAYTGGTNATNVFQINGANYTTCSAYKAAVETTATCSGF